MVPDVRPPEKYPSIFVNMSSSNAINSRKGSPTSPHFVHTVPTVNTVPINPMAGTDIKLPIFNGNGAGRPITTLVFV